MNTDNIILRQNNYPPLTNKGAVLDSDDFDDNFINVYKDFEALKATDSVAAYSGGTTYDDTNIQFATYSGRFWQWINAAPGIGIVPVNGIYWQETFPSIMAHRKNSDTILDEGGANEISAADIVAGLALADATTDLSITTQTPTSLQLNSSTGTDVVFLEATQDIAGLLSAADKIKLVNTSGFNTGDQTLGGLNGEDVDNKAVDFLTVNHTLYPSVEAVDTHVQTFANAKLDQTLGANTTVELATFDLDFVNGSIIINSAYTLPNVDGTAGQTIQTDGAGGLTWEDAAIDTNAGNTNLIADANREYTLDGSLPGSTYIFKNDGGGTVFTIAGNQTIWSSGKNSHVSATAFGQLALNTVSASSNNTAFGYKSLETAIGAGNTAIGANSGKIVTICQNSTLIGTNTGQIAVGGADMVCLGKDAGYNFSYSQRGTFVGTAAGYNVGSTNNNTMIGYRAGYGVTSGGGNIFLGARTTTSSGVTSGAHNVVIGNDPVIGNVSNNIIITDGQANQLIRKDANNNQILGAEAALLTTATDGFTYLPTCAGIPTGTPTAVTGKVPIVIDSTNNKMYIYSGGAWVALN